MPRLRKNKSESSVVSVSEVPKPKVKKSETRSVLESVTETAEQVASSVLETVTETVSTSPGLAGKKHISRPRDSETASVTQTMDIIGSIYMPQMMETSFESQSQTRTQPTTNSTSVTTSYLSDNSLLTSDAVTTDCTSQDESEPEDNSRSKGTSDYTDDR